MPPHLGSHFRRAAALRRSNLRTPWVKFHGFPHENHGGFLVNLPLKPSKTNPMIEHLVTLDYFSSFNIIDIYH